MSQIQTSVSGSLRVPKFLNSKSITSLVYHIPFFKNHRLSLNKHLGTTYQFYIWR